MGTFGENFVVLYSHSTCAHKFAFVGAIVGDEVGWFFTVGAGDGAMVGAAVGAVEGGATNAVTTKALTIFFIAYEIN